MSVVIPTVGRPIIQKCLQSIITGDVHPYAIIVVDQSSNPMVGEWLERCQRYGIETKHICSNRTGRAAGVNEGLRNVTTRYCAITDDDCLVAPDWIKNIFAHLQAQSEQVVTGRVEAVGEEDVSITVTSLVAKLQTKPRLTFDSLCGGNMGVAMKVIEKVGPLDEDPVLRCSEDGEWAYRALRSGVAIAYAPEVLVRHYGWRNSAERDVQYRNYALSHGGFYGKYLRKFDWFIALRVGTHFLRELRRLIRGKLRRTAEDTTIAKAYLRWLGPGIIAGLKSQYEQR